MSRTSVPEYRNTPLDPEQLNQPFRTLTSWHVITGSSCSGKTTLINQLAEAGFQTVPEGGRLFFERELAKGRKIDEIRADPAQFTPEIYRIMLENEADSKPDQLLFFDRAQPDSYAFYRASGLDPNAIIQDGYLFRYESVFMLERFPYQKDGVRTADDETADYLERWIARDYSDLGYNLIWVPVLPREERLAFVLEKIGI